MSNGVRSITPALITIREIMKLGAGAGALAVPVVVVCGAGGTVAHAPKNIRTEPRTIDLPIISPHLTSWGCILIKLHEHLHNYSINCVPLCGTLLLFSNGVTFFQEVLSATRITTSLLLRFLFQGKDKCPILLSVKFEFICYPHSKFNFMGFE